MDAIPVAPPDPILGLLEAFQKDARSDKINLSVGVYQNESGRTPTLECVRRAEAKLLESGEGHGYLGIDGHPAFVARARRLVFGADAEPGGPLADRLAVAQTPGGTAALRVAADFLHAQFPSSRVWLSQPTWVNHAKIFQSAGFPIGEYPYFDARSHGLDLDRMLDALGQAGPRDIVCLHACCHNPTGVDPSAAEWERIADILRDRNLIPVVDFAYQGFGDGLDEDSAGLNRLVAHGLELVVCGSYSKNFGLYGERVGAVAVRARTPRGAGAALSQIKSAIRANYSSPPRHGAAIVATILNDAELDALWRDEVVGMRRRIRAMRELFVRSLAEHGVDQDFSFLLKQRGMFSFSGLNRMQVDELRSRHAIYIVDNGRINVAGMTTATMDRLCRAIASVLAS